MRRKLLSSLSGVSLPHVFAITALLRFVYWVTVSDEPWFQTPGMDPEFYRGWASAILAGHGSDYIPFPRAPLYSYVLAGIMMMFGSELWIPRLFNLCCDFLSVTVIWSIGKRTVGTSAAFLAAMFFAVSGMAIYMSGELLMTSLETALAALFLLFLIDSLESPGMRNAALTGGFAALLSLCRPNALLLVIAVPVLLVFYSKRNIFKILQYSSTSLVTALIILTPVIWLNYAATGRVIPVATQGGVNFFIGNARGATGWSSSLPGIGADWTDADAEKVAETEAGRQLDAHGQSRQLFKLGFEEIIAAPLDWLTLMFRKILLITNIREIGNNRPLTLPIESAPFMRYLFMVSIGGLLPLVLVGLKISHHHKALIFGASTFIALFGGSLLLFFISSRYRMPLMPVTAIFAGIGLDHIVRNLKNHSYRHYLPVFLIGALICLPPWAGSHFDDSTQGYFAAGNALLKQNRYSDAMQLYDRVNNAKTDYPKLHLNRGVALMAAGDTLDSIKEFELELARYPNRGEALNNLAVIAENRGDRDRAIELYRKAASQSSGNRDAAENLLRIYLQIGDALFQRGELDSAEYIYRQAADIPMNDPRPFYRMALVAATNGQFVKARELTSASLNADPKYQPALNLLRELH